MKDWTHTIGLVVLGLLLAWNSYQDCQRWKLSQQYFALMNKQSNINAEVITMLGELKGVRRR